MSYCLCGGLVTNQLFLPCSNCGFVRVAADLPNEGFFINEHFLEILRERLDQEEFLEFFEEHQDFFSSSEDTSDAEETIHDLVFNEMDLEPAPYSTIPFNPPILRRENAMYPENYSQQ